MEFLLANPQIHSTFASLGTMQGDTYIVNEDCLTILEEINYKLSVEGKLIKIRLILAILMWDHSLSSRFPI